MLSEMEVTGQAFEDMQEQNVRLLQQLREKDDANFKLMSEVAVPLYIFLVILLVGLTVCSDQRKMSAKVLVLIENDIAFN